MATSIGLRLTRSFPAIIVGVWRALPLLALRIATVALLVAAVFVGLAQPSTKPIDAGALIGIAGLLATVLSLGLTVTLLVAQHTAENHARALYQEFRRERAWLIALASLGVSMVVVVAAALQNPTHSTAWASLALVTALGLFSASLFPQLLGSLDRTELARRMADRMVRQLKRVERKSSSGEREARLKPIANRGIDIMSGLAVEGVASSDRDVVRAGLAGLRSVLIAYIRESPTRGWDGDVINYAFQHLEVALDLCLERSPVLLLPVALEQVTAMAVESPTTLADHDQYDNLSIRLNSLFIDIAARTMTADSSPAAAMATGGIGDGGAALIQAGRSIPLSDHIRRLGVIAQIALRAERDHLVGQANHELARIALGLARLDKPHDVMPPSLYQDAVEEICRSIDMFVSRTTSAGALMRDTAMTSINGPFASPNLSFVILAGLVAHSRDKQTRSRDFLYGAEALEHCLLRLGTYRTEVVMTPSYALDTAYSALLGSLALDPTEDIARASGLWWIGLIKLLSTPAVAEHMNARGMMARLLVIGVIEATEGRPHVSPQMRDKLLEALQVTRAIPDQDDRRRASLAWLDAGRAAVTCGDEMLARTVARSVGGDILSLRRSFTNGVWYDLEEDEVTVMFDSTVPGMLVRNYPAAHRRRESVQKFEALLREEAGVKRARPRKRRTRATGSDSRETSAQSAQAGVALPGA